MPIAVQDAAGNWALDQRGELGLRPQLAAEAVNDAGEVIAQAGDVGTSCSDTLLAAGVHNIKVRSVLTCESARGVPPAWPPLATGKLVDIGEAVGIIAAQSIGEPARSSHAHLPHRWCGIRG
jgi:DNA-directed RNA polymerase subunit beta'